MVTCSSGLYQQTSKGGSLYVQNIEESTHGGLPAVYNAIIQAESIYVAIIRRPAQVVCIYKTVRQVHYTSRTMNNATRGRMPAIYNVVIQVKSIYVDKMYGDLLQWFLYTNQ